MLHDEDIYPEPHAFKPDRWLGKPRDPNTHVLDVVFGFGRRQVAFTARTQAASR